MIKKLFAVLAIAITMPANESQSMTMDDIVRNDLTVIANNISESCPRMLDETLRLDNVTTGPGKMIIYRQTITNLSSKEMSAADMVAQTRIVRPQLVKNLCSEGDYYKKNNVTVMFNYAANDGVHVASIVLVPAKECK